MIIIHGNKITLQVLFKVFFCVRTKIHKKWLKIHENTFI